MTDLPCAVADDGYCRRHGVEHGLETSTKNDLPSDFRPKYIEYVDGDPIPYAITKDGRPMSDELKAYRQGWNNALFATDAANLLRERDALEADFFATLTSEVGLSEATARRIVDATLREARGEP